LVNGPWAGFMTGGPVGEAWAEQQKAKPVAVADKTAVHLDTPAKKHFPTEEMDRQLRTFPINNKWHFLNKSNKGIRAEILRKVKEGNVKASPVDMDEIEDSGILYPPEEDVFLRDFRLDNFKRKLYKNNPDWEAEEKEWKRRKLEGGFE